MANKPETRSDALPNLGGHDGEVWGQDEDGTIYVLIEEDDDWHLWKPTEQGPQPPEDFFPSEATDSSPESTMMRKGRVAARDLASRLSPTFLDNPRSVIFKIDDLISKECKNHRELIDYEEAMNTILNSPVGKRLVLRYDKALEKEASRQGRAAEYRAWKEARAASGTVAEREKRQNRQKLAKNAKAVFNVETLYVFKIAGAVLNRAEKRRWKKLQFLVREVETRLP